MRANSPKHLRQRGGKTWDTTGVLLDEALATGPVDLEAVFGNTHPVEVEIGTGKGTFLLARSQARKDLNFLGIEYAGAYCRYAADRFRRHGLPNVRMLHADAGHVFRVCLAPRSLLRVHVYFPDPWPKRRHRRRRLIQPAFITDVRRALRIGGQLIIVSDHMDYFRQIRRVLAAAPPGLATLPMPKMTDADGQLVGTNFERKYIAEGRVFYATARLRYR